VEDWTSGAEGNHWEEEQKCSRERREDEEREKKVKIDVDVCVP